LALVRPVVDNTYLAVLHGAVVLDPDPTLSRQTPLGYGLESIVADHISIMAVFSIKERGLREDSRCKKRNSYRWNRERK
jgi:hypothetical protein